MSTIKRMQAACGQVSNGEGPHRNFIQACAAVADEMVEEVAILGRMNLRLVAAQARANSQRWFPRVHDDRARAPLAVHYALGLAGEAGEVANLAKKSLRGAGDMDPADLGPELADVFTYLLLLADEAKIDLIVQFADKQAVCEKRWGEEA